MELLKLYVEQGGTLIIGCRAGYKDMNGRCVMEPQPGLFAKLTGSDIKEYTFTSPAEVPVYADWNGREMEMPVFNDIMEPAGGKVLAAYKNSYYAGKAWLHRTPCGKRKSIASWKCFFTGKCKNAAWNIRMSRNHLLNW